MLIEKLAELNASLRVHHTAAKVLVVCYSNDIDR